MRKSSTALFATTALALASVFTLPLAGAQTAPPFPPTKALEDIVESSTDDALMPTSAPGTITFRNCAEPCAVRSLMVTGQSTFFVGPTQVALADFNEFLRSAGARPLTVVRELNGTNVLRVQVIGQLAEFGQTKPSKTRRAK